MSNPMKIFIYMSSHKDVAVHSVSSIEDDGFYFRGYCLEKKKVLTFRHDRVMKIFENAIDANAYLEKLPDALYLEFDERINAQKNIKYGNASNANPLNKLTFCFSGFKKERKAELLKLLEENDLRAVTTISHKVDFFVIDDTSNTVGPAKLNKATEYGIQIINESEFLLMLETGEIPS